jgi:hypothetical protein
VPTNTSDHHDSHGAIKRRTSGGKNVMEFEDPTSFGSGKVVIDFACSKANQEVEYSYALTLNQRALILVQTDDYLNKVKAIKKGNAKIKSMEFIMDGIKIELPYLGAKVTQGYLKKETKEGIFGSVFQTKFCLLDLTKFVFKYAKAPTDKFTTVNLKDIIDVVIEKDPKGKAEARLRASQDGFSGMFQSNQPTQADEGYNFAIKTSKRDFRMQSLTKQDQKMWLRALNILFELRARVSQNLKTTLDINNHLGVEESIRNTIGPVSSSSIDNHQIHQRRNAHVT